MVFNDETNLENSILHDISFYTGADKGITDADSFIDFTLAERTRSINKRYGEICLYILMCNIRFVWDDANHTDAPSFRLSLVDGQSNYTIIKASPSTNQDWLMFDQVEVSDADGNWTILDPIDRRDTNQAWPEFEETDSTPRYYDFNGKEILLKPAPNYDLTNGLRIYPARNPLYFATTATDKRPGFATPLHSALSLGASIDFLKARNNKGQFNVKIQGFTEEYVKLVGNPIMEIDGLLQSLYARRNRDEIPVIKGYKRNYR